jgi:RNA polymerase sigma-70 factor (ECF subfamily)
MALAVGVERPTQARPLLEAPGLDATLRAVYAEHFARVWRSLRRLGVPEAQLEDAVQDVFVVVHRRWSEFQGRSSLETWIYGIVLRVAKDYRRSEERHARRVQGLLQATVAEPRARAPDEEAERREARRLIHDVLQTLPDEQRELLVLIELEQLPLRDAAQALGLHVRACQRRLRAAHLALEAGLAAHLGSPGRSTP